MPGSYARFLIAKTDESSNLTVENFDIRFDLADSRKLIISQIDYEFENRNPVGTVHVVSRNDIVEIRIDYESDRDPMGTFLAPFPSEHPVTHILAVALDIHYNTRNVLAKPVLFMRQQRLYDKKDRFEPSEPIYKKVRQLFREFVKYNSSRMELSISRNSPATKIKAIQKELERLRTT